METLHKYTKNQIWEFLRDVKDPEIPVLDIIEMGIARSVEFEDDKVIVKITPTYSGCPAMHAIEKMVREKLIEKDIFNFDVILDYSEAWTTDWMTKEAKTKLKDFGIAPPNKTTDDGDFLKTLTGTKVVPCPFCDSFDTELVSEFGSTACKSQYFCNGCTQPFEHFKCH